MDTTTQSGEIVKAALQVVFSEHRVDQIDRFFAADFVQHSPYAAPLIDQSNVSFSGLEDKQE